MARLRLVSLLTPQGSLLELLPANSGVKTFYFVASTRHIGVVVAIVHKCKVEVQ